MTKKLLLSMLLMLMIPVGAWIVNYQWMGDEYAILPFDYILLLITETSTSPYAIITCVILTLLLMWLTRQRYSWLLIGTICVLSMIGTQSIKTIAKQVFAEPRPYVQKMTHSQPDTFYQLTKKERSQFVKQYYQNFPLLAQHRMHEVGYSFPSGHAIFVASWLFLFVGFCHSIRNKWVKLSQSLIILWGILMLISRLRLGMHYPIDLFVSIILSGLFHIGIFAIFIPYITHWKFFAKRS